MSITSTLRIFSLFTYVRHCLLYIFMKKSHNYDMVSSTKAGVFLQSLLIFAKNVIDYKRLGILFNCRPRF